MRQKNFLSKLGGGTYLPTSCDDFHFRQPLADLQTAFPLFCLQLAYSLQFGYQFTTGLTQTRLLINDCEAFSKRSVVRIRSRYYQSVSIVGCPSFKLTFVEQDPGSSPKGLVTEICEPGPKSAIVLGCKIRKPLWTSRELTRSS